MKNILRKLLAAVLFSFAFVPVFALEAEVISVSGKVEIQKGDAWVALKPGDIVKTGDLLSTGFKSEATLKIAESTLTLGPLTRLTVEKLAASAAADETNVFIDTGSVKAEVNHEENRRVGFKVSSPVATASVRGTVFTSDAAGNVKTILGLVSKGPAESDTARIAEGDSATQVSFVPAEGESTATTPTSAVSEKPGIPLYEGQSSSTDAISGSTSSAQTELVKEYTSLGSGTTSQTSLEGISSGSGSTGGSSSGSGSTVVPPKTELIIDITVK